MHTPISLTVFLTSFALIQTSYVEAATFRSNRRYLLQSQGKKCCAFVFDTNPHKTCSWTRTKKSLFLPVSNDHSTTAIVAPTATSTSLQMGIRSFFRNSLGKANDDNNYDALVEKEKPSVVKEALEAIRADLEAVDRMEDTRRSDVSVPKPSVIPVVAPPISPPKSVSPPPKSVSPPPKSISVPAPTNKTPPSPNKGETTTERIQRLRSGSMTEKEKVQFLQTALSSTEDKKETAPTDGRKIRAPLQAKFTKRGGKDNLSMWDVVGGGRGKTEERSVYGISQGGEMSDAAKREYLAMITDPDRFKSYSIVGQPSKVKEEETTTEDAAKNDDELIAETTTQEVNKDDEDVTTPPPVDEQIEQNESPVIANDASTDTDKSTLGTRLEEDAILREKKANEAKIKREEERALLQKVMEEERIKAEEEKIEQERLEKLQREREIQRERLQREREVQRIRREEEERLQKVIEAQEAYWKKKLEEEKKYEGEKITYQKVVVVPEKKKEETTPYTPLPSMSSVNPTVKPKPVEKKVSPFIREQERKRAEMERKKAEYREKVQGMNSPIPATPLSVKPVIPVTTTEAVPAPPPQPSPFSQLIDAGKPSPTDDDKFTKTTPLPEPDDVGSPSLTQLSDTPQLSEEKSTNFTPPPPDSYSTPSQAELTSSRMTILSQLNRKKEPEAKGSESATMATSSSTSDRAESTTSASSSDGVVGEQKRIIRQQIPLADGDDFDEYGNGGSNENLSIKEIMERERLKNPPKRGDDEAAKRERSKRFGINLDKLYP